MGTPQQFPIARQSAGHAPPRRPASIRRTTSIDSEWPEGYGQPWLMIGRARDLYTPPDGDPIEFATGGFQICVSPAREILSIQTTPAYPRAQELVGVRAGGLSRQKLGASLGDVRGTPTYQLLDDFAGASLVAGWIWSRWTDDWMPQPAPGSTSGRAPRYMVDICTGFAAGAASLHADGSPRVSESSSAEVGPLEHPDDPAGWHVMPIQSGPRKRRARRIDLWLDDGLMHVDAGFQDSGSNPNGGRTAIHEYRVYASIDMASHRLATLQALPLILPYRECPGASVKATRLIGQDVRSLRDSVIETLAGPMGCTHLNDVLRALADVPALARRLAAGAV